MPGPSLGKVILPIYYIYGTETYLMDEEVKALKERVLSHPFKDLNCQTFYAKEADTSTILGAVQTLPVMAPWRFVLVKEAEALTNSQLEGLIPYINNPVPTTSLVFIAYTSKVDKRLSFFSILGKRGYLFYFGPLFRNQLPSWIKGEARRLGKGITDEAIGRLLEVVGDDLGDIKGEMDKLALYVGENGMIDEADVEAVVAPVRMDTIFDLTESIGRRELKKALLALQRVMEGGEAPPKILAMIARQFRILWRVKTLDKKGVSKERFARLVGVSPNYLDGYMRQSKGFGEGGFLKIFKMLHRADMAIKSERLQGLILERLVMDLCSTNSRS